MTAAGGRRNPPPTRRPPTSGSGARSTNVPPTEPEDLTSPPGLPCGCYRCARRFTCLRYLARHVDEARRESQRLLADASAPGA